MQTLNITRKTKKISQNDVLNLLRLFIKESSSGIRKKKNGQNLKLSTVKNYLSLEKNIQGFLSKRKIELNLYIDINLTQNERTKASKYYSKFYNQFTNYLYYEKECFDNYVGLMIKTYKTFINYLIDEKNIPLGRFHVKFYKPIEQPPILVLNIAQLNQFIFDEEFNQLIIDKNLEKVRDIFVLGCVVSLRISDLLKLNSSNLKTKKNTTYLMVKSIKTSKKTCIKLPQFAVQIINKYQGNQRTLLPSVSSSWFNYKLKELIKLLPSDNISIKTRERKGKPTVIYKNKATKSHYNFSDLASTHLMRKTGITTMLSLGMEENLVRKVSGHSPNSAEFYRYVEYSQDLIDNATEKVFKKLRNYK